MALRSPLTVQPYDYIADSNGRPLDYGQVYIGVANQDPEFYQIPVYLDAAMTKPIDQPIRTNDGFVDFAGSLSELYASAEVYSVKVLDKEGRKVLYKGDMTRKNLMSDALADLNQSIIDTQTAAQITLNAAVNSANTEVAQTVSLATAAIDTATTKSNKAATDADAAIKTLFENGGLPAEPFATKAKMETDGASLAHGQLAQVYNEAVNNGLYVKTAGVWVKATYDPVGQSKAYVDNSIKPIRDITYNSNMSSDTHQFTDVSGNILAKIKSDGSLHVTGLTTSVQHSIQENHNDINTLKYNNKVTTEKYKNCTHAFTDEEGYSLFELYDDGTAYFVGLEKDLVSSIADAAGSGGGSVGSGEIIKNTDLAESRGYKDTFVQSGQSLLNNTFYGQTGVKAPPPMDFFPQNFTLNKTWINNIQQFSHATSNRLTIDTPYHTDGGVVHPHIIEFYNGFRGFRYIVCITPYHLNNESEENPCIYGSNDLINFELLDGFTQPLDIRPQPAFSTGHNSDNILTYNPKTGELICVWRQSLRDPLGDGVRTDALWMRKTKDGYTWTDKERIFLSTKNTVSGAAGSPAILYDAKTDYWYMYVTTLSQTVNAMKLFKAKRLNEDAWEFVQELILPFKPWHQEVRFVGDKVMMLVACYPPNDAVYVGISDNFTDFTWSSDLLLSGDIYKPSFIPVFDNANNVALKILYTTNASPVDESEKWRMYSTTTNFINADVTAI